MINEKRIATYARVSTARQEEEQTIQTQLSIIKEEIERKGYQLVREYADEGWSGDTLARPGLDQLRADAKSGLFNAVLIYDPDRLARRYSYQELVMDELREAGIEVIFITISAPKNSEDKILYGVRGLFAEYERAKISERFRLGKVRKVKEGHILVSESLYGYTYIPKKDNQHGYYVINEKEAEVVKMIFSWVGNDGLTLRKVVIRLQEMGIPPRKSKRGVWNTSTLSTMLRHRGYIGETRWGSSYAVVPTKPLKQEKYRKVKKTSRRIKPKEEWYSIPIPPIIDQALFNQVDRQLEINFARSQRNKKNNYLLVGKIWCTCGERRCGEGPQKGKHLYYRCNSRVSHFPLPSPCQEKGINARIADAMVWEKIVELMSSPQLLLEQAQRYALQKSSEEPKGVPDLNTIQKDIEQLRLEEDRYNKAYGAGVFTVVQLAGYVAPIRKKIALLAQQISSVQAEEEAGPFKLPNPEQFETLAVAAKEMLSNLSFEQKREIVLLIVQKVIGTKQNVHVIGHIPIPEAPHKARPPSGVIISDFASVLSSNVNQSSIHRDGQDTTGKRIEVPFVIDIKFGQSK